MIPSKRQQKNFLPNDLYLMRYSPKEGQKIFNNDYVEELNYSKLVKENT